MYLYCYRKTPNFGDALNFWLWKKTIQVELGDDDGDEEVFVGIGTILNERLPRGKRLHIFGSGAGYGAVRTEDMASWRVHFVRGPRTAQVLGISTDLAITDPAVLLHRHVDLDARKDFKCSFMPHHTIDSDRYKVLCEKSGVHYISPFLNCDEVIDQLVRSERLICSAMHGAIVAEALRVPWLPVLTHSEIFDFKWRDWADSLYLDIEFEQLPTVYRQRAPGLKNRITGAAKDLMVIRKLDRLARSGRFILGDDRVLESRIDQIEAKIEVFNKEYGSSQ